MNRIPDAMTMQRPAAYATAWTHRVGTGVSLGLVCAVSFAKGAPD
jgi:hypothetical protein